LLSIAAKETTMRIATYSFTLGLGLCAGLTACIDDTADNDAPTNEITSDLKIAGGVTISGGSAKLGKLTEQSCFLSGVKGDLVALPPSLAIAEVFRGSDGFWHAHATSGVTAVVNCVNYPDQGTSMELTFENNLTGGQVFTKAHRRCFLTRVAASIGFQHNIEDPFPPMLAVSDNGSGQWWWGDSFMSEDSGSNDFGDASAQCVDAPDSSIAWGIPAPVTGPVKTTMVVDSAGNGIATAGTECALSGISGRWDKPDPTLGSNVGVTLSSTGQFWTVTTSGNRAARISCWR
jgi:hypothetical protein